MSKELQIYALLPHQEESHSSPCRYKLLRRGRRGAKSREALYAAVMGHGPAVNDHALWKGILDGAKIAWIAPDYQQAKAIWTEEILPRFEGVAGVEVRKSKGDWAVELRNGGLLRMVSAENIDALRGSKFHGVICDEAAHWDLESGWKNVIRHTLIDYRGWAYFPSTPNFGKDGNEKRPHGPSYFNILCQKQLAAELSEEWGQWHSRSHDNPKLPPDELAQLEKDFEDTPYAYQQEVLALLLEGVEGIFFTEFKRAIHVKEVKLPAQGVWYAGGLDWGYSSPQSPAGWLGIEAFWESLHGSRRHVLMEFGFHGLDPYQAGYQAGKAMLPYPRPEFIAADLSMWDTGDGRGGMVTPLAEEFQRGLDDACGRDVEGHSRAPQLIKAPKGKQSREVRALAMRAALKYKTREVEVNGEKITVVPPWGEPELTIHPRCTLLARSIETLPTDPTNPELPATEKVFDHPYDGETYLAVTRRPELPKPEVAVNPNRSFDRQKFTVHVEEEDARPPRRFRGRRERAEA